jgi:osmoprotectant transport system ATP-binding protein
MQLRFEGVYKAFGGTPVLQDISLTLEHGRTHILLGSSGSGKSTLLRVTAGLLAADRGGIWLAEDRSKWEMTPASQPALAPKIGYVIQEGGLFPHLTARSNLALQARILDWDEARIAARIHVLVDLVGLSSDPSLLDRFPGELSGGQRQRVALMRALMLEPPILLLDEPLGALDPLVRSSLQRELRAIFRAIRCTVVLVTHDISEAAFFGDTITLLHQGRIEQHGTLAEMAKTPATPFVTEFVRSQRPPEELSVLG